MPELTDDRIAELAAALVGTTKNVHCVADTRFGADADDSVFDRLRAAGVMECEGCGRWQRAENFPKNTPEEPTCLLCLAEAEDDEDDDDDE